jgi:plasmid maintenance system antidote protein VapI
MSGAKEPAPISDLLRQTIADSGIPLKRLERETGVTRASIMRFVRGSQFLRLDMADRLAAYLGLRLARRPGKERRKAPPG